MVEVKHGPTVLDLVENYNFDIERVFVQSHLKILKIWNSKYGNLIYISEIVKDLKLKFCQLKVLELVGLHKFDINFITIEVHLKKIWIYLHRSYF